MTPDREQRRLEARAEGRRAAGIGPAVVISTAAGIMVFLCGGIVTIMFWQDYYAASLQGESAPFWPLPVLLLYLLIGVAQLLAARRLARRHDAHRRGRVGDAELTRACVAALAAAAAHALFPPLVVLGAWARFLLDPVPAPGPPATTVAISTGCHAVPFEILPVAALLLTLRAWRRLTPEAGSELSDADGAVLALDPAEVRTARTSRLLIASGIWGLVGPAVGVLWGGSVALFWLPFEGGDGTSALALLVLHAGMMAALGLAGALLWRRRDATPPEQSRALATAITLAWVHAAVVAFVVLGLLAAAGSSLCGGLVVVPFAEVAPLLVVQRLRQAARELGRLAPGS